VHSLIAPWRAHRRGGGDAEIIGIIDADYVVHPDWLKEKNIFWCRFIFAGSGESAWVQARQEQSRDGDRSLMQYIHERRRSTRLFLRHRAWFQRNEMQRPSFVPRAPLCLLPPLGDGHGRRLVPATPFCEDHRSRGGWGTHPAAGAGLTHYTQPFRIWRGASCPATYEDFKESSRGHPLAYYGRFRSSRSNCGAHARREGPA